MADAVDMAATIEAEHLARALGRIDAAIPAGVAGDCDECGEAMPRLVDGRCGFCRDGRRPPVDRYPDRASIAVPIHQPRKEIVVPTQPDVRNITIQARGDLRLAIEQRAEADNVALGRAAQDLVELGLRALAAPAPAPTAEPDGSNVPTAISLANVPAAWLTEELVRRIDQAASADDLARAWERATAAEAKLAFLASHLRGEAA